MARRRPLHTCASSCIGIAEKAYNRVQDLDGPLASTAKRATIRFFPLVHTILYQILTILSFIDDRILAVEAKMEKIVPQSTYLFDKVDDLVRLTECQLPQQFDNVMTKIPSIVHHVPLLERLLAHLMSYLNMVVSILLTQNTREKDIRVLDMNCKTEENKAAKTESSSKGNLPKGVVHLSVKRFHSWKSRMKALEEPLYAGDSPMYSCYQSANSSPVSDSSSPDAALAASKAADNMGCSYKEILERGTKEEEERENAAS